MTAAAHAGRSHLDHARSSSSSMVLVFTDRVLVAVVVPSNFTVLLAFPVRLLLLLLFFEELLALLADRSTSTS